MLMKLAIAIHIIIALLMIFIILLQPSSRNNINSTFGNSDIKFAAGNKKIGSFLNKITFLIALCFMITNLALSVLISDHGSVFVKTIH